jgi:hypothetical protein
MKYDFIRLAGVSSRQPRVRVKKRDMAKKEMMLALTNEDVLHRKSIATEM